jgi:tRNA pseudouridine55 synthase
MYSAVKHHGQRLYHLARQGITVPRQPRQIFIQRLTLLDICREGQVTFTVTCSKGTYIRTLCEDIGFILGCGAHMMYLQRCQIGPFHLSQAHSPIALDEYARRGDFTNAVIPLADALCFVPALMLTEKQYLALRLDHKKVLPTIFNPMNNLQQSATCYRLCTKSNGPFAVVHQISRSPERWRFQYFNTSLDLPSYNASY